MEKGLRFWLLAFAWVCWAAPLPAQTATNPEAAFVALQSLCDPAKLATLKSDRPANDRVRKITYWLEIARREGEDPEVLAERVMATYGWSDERGKLTAATITRNRVIAERLGCLTDEGMEKLRRGRAPVVQWGPYKDDVLAVDHIIPRSIVPELDASLVNLELMPQRMNLKKSNSIGERQLDLAKKLYEVGLISKEGFQAVVGLPPHPEG